MDSVFAFPINTFALKLHGKIKKWEPNQCFGCDSEIFIIVPTNGITMCNYQLYADTDWWMFW